VQKQLTDKNGQTESKDDCPWKLGLPSLFRRHLTFNPGDSRRVANAIKVAGRDHADLALNPLQDTNHTGSKFTGHMNQPLRIPWAFPVTLFLMAISMFLELTMSKKPVAVPGYRQHECASPGTLPRYSHL
jgi:hypothetical protein